MTLDAPKYKPGREDLFLGNTYESHHQCFGLHPNVISKIRHQRADDNHPLLRALSVLSTPEALGMRETSIIHRTLPQIGAVLTEGDIIVGRHLVIETANGSGDKKIKDCSVRFSAPGKQSMNEFIVTDLEIVNERKVCVYFSEKRKHIHVGDKVAAMPGQKGLISSITEDDEMPFDPETGRVVEFIIGNGAMSRYTPGLFHNALIDAICVETGRRGIQSSQYEHGMFFGLGGTVLLPCGSIYDAEHYLRSRGKSIDGTLINGRTGSPILGSGFVGTIRIHVLPETAENKFKIISSSQGSIDSRTGHASKEHNASMRKGHMELAALRSFGGASMMREHFEEASGGGLHGWDTLCRECGHFIKKNVTSLEQKKLYGLSKQLPERRNTRFETSVSICPVCYTSNARCITVSRRWTYMIYRMTLNACGGDDRLNAEEYNMQNQSVNQLRRDSIIGNWFC